MPAADPEEDVVALLLALETLKARLAVAQKEADLQRFLVEGLKRELASLQRPPDADDPYIRLQVREGIPDFALRALRNAYRKAHHPDLRPAGEREEARRAFLAFEAAFDAIAACRRGDAA